MVKKVSKKQVGVFIAIQNSKMINDHAQVIDKKEKFVHSIEQNGKKTYHNEKNVSLETSIPVQPFQMHNILSYLKRSNKKKVKAR